MWVWDCTSVCRALLIACDGRTLDMNDTEYTLPEEQVDHDWRTEGWYHKDEDDPASEKRCLLSLSLYKQSLFLGVQHKWSGQRKWQKAVQGCRSEEQSFRTPALPRPSTQDPRQHDKAAPVARVGSSTTLLL